MLQRVLLVQGGSKGAYVSDMALADSLRRNLGPGYDVRYPAMPDEGEPNYDAWKAVILEEVRGTAPAALAVGHSIGGSVLARLMTETDISGPDLIAGVFLVAAPFWHDHHFWRWDDVALPADAAGRFPAGAPLFLYHGEADASVPVSHLRMYARALPQGVVRALPGRDHQLNGDMSEVARDICGLRAAHASP
ncbi:alpha/beta hydrolase [Phenylobacterium deserti]|nr:alpha/beta hydrolase [Phenylobacterium deserti]